MNDSELKDIAENFIETTELAGNKSMELYKKGLKKIAILKPDHGRSNALCNLLVKELQERKIKTA